MGRWTKVPRGCRQRDHASSGRLHNPPLAQPGPLSDPRAQDYPESILSRTSGQLLGLSPRARGTSERRGRCALRQTCFSVGLLLGSTNDPPSRSPRRSNDNARRVVAQHAASERHYRVPPWTWWQLPPSQRLVAVILRRRVRFPSTSAIGRCLRGGWNLASSLSPRSAAEAPPRDPPSSASGFTADTARLV
jgi:hypothetical protein